MARLALAVSIGESIYVGDSKITLTGITGMKVHVVVDAAREIPVDREKIRLSKMAGKAVTNGL